MLSAALRRFLPFALAITLLCGIVYVIAQQEYRMAANEPQEQLASEVAAKITAGATPSAVVSGTSVDIVRSEGVFTVVYDGQAKALAGIVVMDGTSVSVPAGAVTYALDHGTNRVSWQPKVGIREALVLKKVNSGTVVVVGRSLREPERRIESMGMTVGFGWVVTLLVTFLAVAVGERRGKA